MSQIRTRKYSPPIKGFDEPVDVRPQKIEYGPDGVQMRFFVEVERRPQVMGRTVGQVKLQVGGGVAADVVEQAVDVAGGIADDRTVDGRSLCRVLEGKGARVLGQFGKGRPGRDVEIADVQAGVELREVQVFPAGLGVPRPILLQTGINRHLKGKGTARFGLFVRLFREFDAEKAARLRTVVGPVPARKRQQGENGP